MVNLRAWGERIPESPLCYYAMNVYLWPLSITVKVRKICFWIFSTH
jgi:hypothetical protein